MNLNQLKSKIKYHNDKLDGLSDDLVKALTDYQREYERLLLKTNFDTVNGRLKPTISNYNKAQSLDPMTKLGFNKLAMQYETIETASAKVGFDFVKSIGIATSLGMKDITQLASLKKIDLGLMYNASEKLDRLIKKELVNNIAMGKDYNKSVEDIGASLLGMGEKEGQLARYAETYMRNSLFVISGSVRSDIYKDAGYDKFIYAGPIDNKTSEICRPHVGGEYTLEQVLKLGEQYGTDPFLMGLHFNCRHQFVGIPSDI